jgi:hypothetical protein
MCSSAVIRSRFVRLSHAQDYVLLTLAEQTPRHIYGCSNSQTKPPGNGISQNASRNILRYAIPLPSYSHAWNAPSYVILSQIYGITLKTSTAFKSLRLKKASSVRKTAKGNRPNHRPRPREFELSSKGLRVGIQPPISAPKTLSNSVSRSFFFSPFFPSFR